MTKHVSPEITGTELSTDYIRPGNGRDDDATMVAVKGEPGWFVNSLYASARRHVAGDKAPRKTTKEVRPKKGLTEFETLLQANTESPKDIEFETLLQANAESPEDITDPFVEKELDRLFKSDETHEFTIQQDGAIFINGRRRVRTKTKYTAISESPWRDFAICKEAKASPDIQTCFRNGAAFRDVGNRHGFLFAGTEFSQPECTGTDAKFRAWLPQWRRFRDIVKSDWFWLFWQVWRYVGRAPFLADVGGNTVPEGLRDTTKETARNRAKIERYNAEYPQKENPDSSIFPRKPRNASPKREQDEVVLNALWRYRELNKSFEPLQSSTERYDDEEREDGDPKQPDAELETRPTENELIALYSVATVKYETRRCGVVDGPIPVSGDVE